MAAFPEDAEVVDLRNIVDTMLVASASRTGLSDILGGKLSDKQVEKLCAAALPLSIDWLKPEQMSNGDEDGIPFQQRGAWEAFYRIAEGLE